MNDHKRNDDKSEETCSDRVRRNTRDVINERIDRQIERNIGYMTTQSNDVIQQRLSELDEEIDIETLLGRVSSTFSLVGLALGTLVNKRLLIIPAMVQGFYLHHTLRGWCPPLPVLRRLGVRTLKEIESEKQALKALLSGSDNNERTNKPESGHNGQSQKEAKQEAR